MFFYDDFISDKSMDGIYLLVWCVMCLFVDKKPIGITWFLFNITRGG